MPNTNNDSYTIFGDVWKTAGLKRGSVHYAVLDSLMPTTAESQTMTVPADLLQKKRMCLIISDENHNTKNAMVIPFKTSRENNMYSYEEYMKLNLTKSKVSLLCISQMRPVPISLIEDKEVGFFKDEVMRAVDINISKFLGLSCCNPYIMAKEIQDNEARCKQDENTSHNKEITSSNTGIGKVKSSRENVLKDQRHSFDKSMNDTERHLTRMFIENYRRKPGTKYTRVNVKDIVEMYKFKFKEEISISRTLEILVKYFSVKTESKEFSTGTRYYILDCIPASNKYSGNLMYKIVHTRTVATTANSASPLSHDVTDSGIKSNDTFQLTEQSYADLPQSTKDAINNKLLELTPDLFKEEYHLKDDDYDRISNYIYASTM